MAPSMLDLARRLYPIPRSLTGDGVRETLRLLGEGLPEGARLDIHEVASGVQVFDWTVPDEWNAREAWIETPDGERVADFSAHRLHLLGYSEPVDREMSLEELRPHLFTDPEHPDRIPYRTSYYRRTWGFCLPHAQADALPEGIYRVKIDATLEPGSLTWGEIEIPATTPGAGAAPEILFSTHVCHPQLANDNLSGLVVMRALAATVAARPERRYGYRFLFLPGTIGSITWLATRSDRSDGARRVAHGLVAANLGGCGPFHYKRTFAGNAPVDRAVERVLRDRGTAFEVEDFSPFGYDERQYNSPGFRLPVGSLTRTPWGRYPEYHSSADDLSLLSEEGLGESLDVYRSVVDVLEADRVWVNLAPHGEPQLGKRGLYSHIGGGDEGRRRQLALLWVLNLSDGAHSLLDVAERSGYPFAEIDEAARALAAADLLAPAEDAPNREDTP